MMKILFIIPAYNETESIINVGEKKCRIVTQYDYVVVNDGLRWDGLRFESYT